MIVLERTRVLARPVPIGRPSRIIQRALEMYGYDRADLIGPCRQRHLAEARYSIIAAMRHFGMSYTQIGQHLGGRDHSTVREGMARADYLCERQTGFADIVAELIEA